jgi:hypothetical protein
LISSAHNAYGMGADPSRSASERSGSALLCYTLFLAYYSWLALPENKVLRSSTTPYINASAGKTKINEKKLSLKKYARDRHKTAISD